MTISKDEKNKIEADLKLIEAKITDAVTQRIIASEKKLEDVYKAISKGNLLKVDWEEDRTVKYIKSMTGVSLDEAKLLQEGMDPTTLNLVGEQFDNFNSIQGKTSKNFLGISFLKLARAAADSVARIVWDIGGPRGTGFMISDKLFLTNNHVIPTEALTENLYAEFDFEQDFRLKPKRVTRFEFDAAKFFMTNDRDNLDFTIVAIGNKVSNGDAGKTRALKDFGYCALSDDDNKHCLGQFVNVIQHPEGDPKKIALRENQLVLRPDNDTVLLYDADTQGGSSGSPVFNDRFMAVALHHRGNIPTRVQGVPKSMNEGIRISAIVKEMKAAIPTLPSPKRKLLEDALNLSKKNPLPSNIT